MCLREAVPQHMLRCRSQEECRNQVACQRHTPRVGQRWTAVQGYWRCSTLQYPAATHARRRAAADTVQQAPTGRLPATTRQQNRLHRTRAEGCALVERCHVHTRHNWGSRRERPAGRLQCRERSRGRGAVARDAGPRRCGSPVERAAQSSAQPASECGRATHKPPDLGRTACQHMPSTAAAHSVPGFCAYLERMHCARPVRPLHN